MSKATGIPATVLDSGSIMDAAHASPPIPGAIRFGVYGAVPDAMMLFTCPCGCGSIGHVMVKAFPGKPYWHNSGTREAPTLHPSIGFSGDHDAELEKDGYHWHGYLKNGVWESC